MYNKLVFLALAAVGASMPAGGIPPGMLSPVKVPYIDSQEDAPASYNEQFAYITGTEVQGGQQITFNYFESIATSFTVGAEIGITAEDVLDIGLSASYTVTSEHGTNMGAAITCPDDASPGIFTCGLLITPNYWQVNGHADTTIGAWVLSTAPYTAMFPKTDPNGYGYVDMEPCLCPNPSNMIYPPPGSVSKNCPGTCGSFGK